VVVLVVVARSSQQADVGHDDHGGRMAVGRLVLWRRHSRRHPSVTLLLGLRRHQGRERRPPNSAFLVTNKTAATILTKQGDAVSERVIDAWEKQQ
jgi:hypothetical protein